VGFMTGFSRDESRVRQPESEGKKSFSLTLGYM
jgi:hypothetical protein